jgi:hypothetical protein
MSFFKADLEPQVLRAEARILDAVRRIAPDAELKRVGPMGLPAPSWSCWITTQTDADRDLIRKDSALLAELFELATKEGFAPDTFVIQSQETVNREFTGSWFYAMR